jgi:hypothetical protein
MSEQNYGFKSPEDEVSLEYGFDIQNVIEHKDGSLEAEIEWNVNGKGPFVGDHCIYDQFDLPRSIEILEKDEEAFRAMSRNEQHEWLWEKGGCKEAADNCPGFQ